MHDRQPIPLPADSAVRFWLALALWGVPLVAILAVLMAGHWVALPRPTRAEVEVAVADHPLPVPSEQGWTVVHVLYAKCRCSRRIFEYLFTRDPAPDAHEVLLLIDGTPDLVRRARARSFDVVELTREELKARFKIESAPMFIVNGPDGEVRYAGGYTTRKQGLDYRDLDVLRNVQAGGSYPDLPLYGCGVSRELQAYLDPIGVKYRE